MGLRWTRDVEGDSNMNRILMICPFALFLAVTPALADGTAVTDSNGFTTYYRDSRGGSAVQFNDSSGLHSEINRSNGRSGTIWRDSNGPTGRYTGRAFEW
jgi:hypothetical protein